MSHEDEFSVAHQSLHRGEDVLPKEVFDAFLKFVECGIKAETAVICAVIFDISDPDPDTRVVKIQFSPQASANRHLDAMCRDVSEMFKVMARNFEAKTGRTQ